MSNTKSFTSEQIEAPAALALETLEAVGESATALVDAWVAAANAAAVQEAAERARGPVRKAARRGLSVLRARKVEIPAPGRRSSLVAQERAKPEAWLMAPDASGVRLLALSRGVSGGAIQAAIVFLRDGQGVFKVENVETTPKKLQASLSKLLPGAGYHAVPVPLEWARYKIAEARAAHKKNKVPEPLGFTTAAALLSPVPETAPEHPFDAEGFEFSEEDAMDLAKDSGALHHEPEFRAWIPTQAAVQELLKKTGQRFTPGSKPEQEQVTEFLKEEMLAATDRYFTPEARAELCGRMKDAALSVIIRAGESEALKVAATIQVIANCGLITNPPRDVPFLRAFFEKAVSILLAQSGGRLNIPIPQASPDASAAAESNPGGPA